MRSYILLAKAAVDTRPGVAAESLEEARRLALKLELAPPRAHLLLAIADVYAEFDVMRLSEVLNDAVKSIARTEQQPRSRCGRMAAETMTIKYDPKWRFPRLVLDDPAQWKKPYDFTALGELALVDFIGAKLLADQIPDKSIRASALYDMCNAVLRKVKRQAT